MSTTVNRIVAFAAAPPPLPGAARAAAERLLADTLMVGAAGAASLEARALRAMLGAGNEARLLGGGHASAPQAAFHNGFAIHCLEWDAVHEGAVVHALSVVTATLLALSDRAGGSDPEDLLRAVAVGVEVAAGLGLSATGPMRFFRPATAGVIGAAAAGSALLGLDVDRTGAALGLAYSFAGGTMQAHVEGSVALPLQIAAAARSAVTAIDLARAGLDGPRDIIDGPFGYHALFEPLDLDRWLPGLGHEWQVERVAVKPFPSGRASHGALAALAAIDRAAVHSLTLAAPPLIVRLVGRPWKAGMTPAYARLCLPFLAALFLRDGRIDPRRFDHATLDDPALAAVAARIDVTDDGNPDGNAMAPQILIVNGTDRIAIPAILGSPDAPLGAEFAAERRGLMAQIAGPDAAALFDNPS